MSAREHAARVMWKRLDVPGHEAAGLVSTGDGWLLTGITEVELDGRKRRLDYDIACDDRWVTQSARVIELSGDTPTSLDIRRGVGGEWTVNGDRRAELDGCVDIDLGFSPSTNLLPIRRLELAIGASALVRAAWLRFPELTLEVLEQRYTRLSERLYLYESANGAFKRELTVNGTGFVIDYPGLWREESTAGTG